LRRFEIPLAASAGLLVLLLSMNFFVPAWGEKGISRIDGLLLLAVFVFFMYQTIKTGLKAGNDDAEEVKLKPLGLSLLMILGGLALLVLGGNWIVNSATAIAKSWGVSDALIGVTVVALGTSLPELAASLAAAAKKNTQMALGNVIGSNIFNLSLILGVASQITPLTSSSIGYIDYGVMIFASVAPLILAFKGKLNRWAGAIMFACFVAYNYYLIVNAGQ
jgi:cation:H+ antiporter